MKGSNNFAKLTDTIETALSTQSVVILEGGILTGKSFTLSKVFEQSSILASKQEGLEIGTVSIKAVQKWTARVGNVAIDEANWLESEQFSDVLGSAVSGKKGVCIAVHSLGGFRHKEALYNIIKKHELSVVFVEMSGFDATTNSPVWSIKQ
jgi:hypothetical protein